MRPAPALPPEPSRRKKIFFVAVIATGLALFVELSMRIAFAFRVGPSVILYGTSFHRDEGAERWETRTVTRHGNAQRGYSKYFPHQSRQDMDPDTGEVFEVGINGRGFRGPEFQDAKAPGTLRVVTLGGSSTFGYSNRDHEAYPRVLEDLLGQRCPGRDFEVINLGIPHQTSRQILALYRAEAAHLDPDVVTFYEGANDTVEIKGSELRSALKRASPTRRVAKELRARILTLLFVDSFLDTRLRSYDREELERNAQGKAESFVENLAQLDRAVAESGAVFIVANQQVQSQTIEREERRGVTYAEEVDRVRRHLEREGSISATEQWLLIHSELMQALEPWAGAHGIPFVDVIGRLDADRSVLVSWVHLSPAGNRQVAAAFADAILPRACPVDVARPAD